MVRGSSDMEGIVDQLELPEIPVRRIEAAHLDALLRGDRPMTPLERQLVEEVRVARRERDDLYGAMLLAEERGAEWAIRAKAQVVYALAGDAAYALLARDVCREARKR